MSRLPADDLQWALQRRLEDVFAKLGEKYGDLTGRIETDIHPKVAFEEVGGLQPAKDSRAMQYARPWATVVSPDTRPASLAAPKAACSARRR